MGKMSKMRYSVKCMECAFAGRRPPLLVTNDELQARITCAMHHQDTSHHVTTLDCLTKSHLEPLKGDLEGGMNASQDPTTPPQSPNTL
jgi:hypothetical protein